MAEHVQVVQNLTKGSLSVQTGKVRVQAGVVDLHRQHGKDLNRVALIRRVIRTEGGALKSVHLCVRLAQDISGHLSRECYNLQLFTPHFHRFTRDAWALATPCSYPTSSPTIGVPDRFRATTPIGIEVPTPPRGARIFCFLTNSKAEQMRPQSTNGARLRIYPQKNKGLSLWFRHRNLSRGA